LNVESPVHTTTASLSSPSSDVVVVAVATVGLVFKLRYFAFEVDESDKCDIMFGGS